jgi:DNA-directed RNA polymerase specialized sigma24 family protein
VATPPNDALDAALTLLGELERSTVHLVYRARQNFAEVADTLSVSPAAVASALMRAYRTIAESLEASAEPAA